MVFYAYLDPKVIGQAFENRPYGYQCLIAMLRGFIQNCCIVDWNGQVGQALWEHVRNLPNDADRLMLKKIIKFLENHHRFVKLQSSEPTSDLSNVLRLALDAKLDVVITTENKPVSGTTVIAEICSLATYQFTEFEHRRSRSAHEGATFCEGEHRSWQFLDLNFRKALRHAGWINICDGTLGRKFGDNYRYTIESFLKWLRETHVRPDACKVTFLCGKLHWNEPDGPRIQQEVREFLTKLGVHVRFYRKLPHDRFIVTDQVALEIGRGMDFLDPGTTMNRDASIASKNLRQVEKLLASYEQFRT